LASMSQGVPEEVVMFVEEEVELELLSSLAALPDPSIIAARLLLELEETCLASGQCDVLSKKKGEDLIDQQTTINSEAAHFIEERWTHNRTSL
jgi:hypothetical protein